MCFKCLFFTSPGEEQIRSHDYMVQTFNVLTMCSDPFTVECNSVKFLHNHGFDFNKLYAKGILYYKGSDRQVGTPGYILIAFKNHNICIYHHM